MTRSEAGKLGYRKACVKLKASNEKQQAEAHANWVPSNCLTCSKEIPYEKRGNKFCNHSCAASFTNQGVQHNKPKPGINPEGKCLNCGQPVKKHRKYCNTQCVKEADFKERASVVRDTGDLWQGWHHEGHIRNYLLRTRPNQCEICGNAEWQGQVIPLVMDHIDGDSTN